MLISLQVKFVSVGRHGRIHWRCRRLRHLHRQGSQNRVGRGVATLQIQTDEEEQTEIEEPQPGGVRVGHWVHLQRKTPDLFPELSSEISGNCRTTFTDCFDFKERQKKFQSEHRTSGEKTKKTFHMFATQHRCVATWGFVEDLVVASDQWPSGECRPCLETVSWSHQNALCSHQGKGSSINDVTVLRG